MLDQQVAQRPGDRQDPVGLARGLQRKELELPAGARQHRPALGRRVAGHRQLAEDRQHPQLVNHRNAELGTHLRRRQAVAEERGGVDHRRPESLALLAQLAGIAGDIEIDLVPLKVDGGPGEEPVGDMVDQGLGRRCRQRRKPILREARAQKRPYVVAAVAQCRSSPWARTA